MHGRGIHDWARAFATLIGLAVLGTGCGSATLKCDPGTAQQASQCAIGGNDGAAGHATGAAGASGLAGAGGVAGAGGTAGAAGGVAGQGGASGQAGGLGGVGGQAGGLAGQAGGAAGHADGGGGAGGAAGGAQTAGGHSGAGGGAGVAFPGWDTPSCGASPAVTTAAGGTFIPIAGTLREIVIDPCNQHVYVTNTTQNRIEDYAVASATLNTPISVGTTPVGLDVTPDNRQVYVANSGGPNVSIVDLATRQELTKVSFTASSSGDTPLSVAVTSNGKVLFSTTFRGTGFGGRLMAFDVTSRAVKQRTDFFVGGSTTEATVLKSSADHTVVGVVAGDISSAPVFVYKAATDAFSPEHDLNGFVSRVTLNPTGSVLAVDGAFLLDLSFHLLGTVTGTAGGPFAAFSPTGTILYRSNASGVQTVNATTFLVSGSIPITGDTLASYGTAAIGNLAVSSDGKWLAMITDHGITILTLP